MQATETTLLEQDYSELDSNIYITTFKEGILKHM